MKQEKLVCLLASLNTVMGGNFQTHIVARAKELVIIPVSAMELGLASTGNPP